MYLSHYNLVEKPFQITTDPKFLWPGKKHQEALAMLKYGVLHSKGFVLLTGDVGTGKTTLINTLQRGLDSSIIVATVVDPNLEILEFFSFLQTAFEIGAKFTKKVDFLTNFREFLNNAYENNKKVLLIIDEAQKLSIELLEEIRVLSNIEKGNTKLLNIFFVGQNEFAKTLTEKESRALRQRITITHQIKPLTESETAEYIKYRLKVAGTEEEIFTKKAIHGIYAFSRGYPRLINIICDHVLLTGYVRGLKTINPAIIKECAKELTIPGETRPNHLQARALRGKHERKPLRRVALYACLLLMIAFCGYLFNALGFKDKIATRFYATRPRPSKEAHQEGVPQRYRANLAMLERGRGDAIDPEEDMIDAAGGDSSTPTLPSPPGPDLDNRLDESIRASSAPGPDLICSDNRVFQESRARAGRAGVKGEDLSGGDEKLIIPFRYNTSELREKAFDTIDRLAAVMIKNPDMEIVVKGYTDAIGSPPYNKNLSELRANSVKKYLVAKGISPLRIQAVGMGEENPLKPNTTPAGRWENRRVEIELQP
ncbi:MAG: OmpA family protein [Deltaproteobacteria bacterium]|nr:OmpA family protein [Deltaproteobacteria bacterium]